MRNGTVTKKLLMGACLIALVVTTADVATADTFWGSGSTSHGTADGQSVLFQFDSSTGTVGTTYTYEWDYLMSATSAPGNLLYAVHNTAADPYHLSIARINAANGAVLSDTRLDSLTGTDYPFWNALEYYNGTLYAVENCAFGPDYTAGAHRGDVYQVALDGRGDPTSTTLGAYVGPYPDGALAYRDGTWYASDWREDYSSWIRTTTDVMGTNFSSNASSASTSPVGLISGWDFEADGDLLGVSWWALTDDLYDEFWVYDIDPLTGVATQRYNLQSQLPDNITWLSGLSAAVVPEPASMAILGMGLVGLVATRMRKRQSV